MSFDLRSELEETFGVTVPPVPIADIRARSRRAATRDTMRWRVIVAAVALASAFTLTLAFERHAPSRTGVPIVSSTPSPIIT